jgi:hypothetical protein
MSRYRVDDGVGLAFPRPIVGSQGDGHVCSVHAAEVVLGQVAGRESSRASGHPQS